MAGIWPLAYVGLVAFLHALLVIAAFIGVAGIPCALGLLVISCDETLLHAIRRLPRRVGARLLRVLVRGRLTNRLAGPLVRRWSLVRMARSMRVSRTLEHSAPSLPPIEHVAADLRRLNRHRLGIAMRSPVWFTAVQRAYDDRLGVACAELRVEQHLTELTGVDLDLERVRVEGRLEAAGLVWRDDHSQPKHWQT
jgi:hypothetical protein